MATIPQANLGLKVAAPSGIPMASGARGFRVNMGQVIGAQEIPRINERAFAVADAANVGEGLQSLGEATMKIADAQLRLYNRQKVLEADGMMVERQAEIAKLIAEERDPRKWVGIAEREAMNSEKLWLTDDLAPDAKDEIQAKSMMWRSRMIAQTTRAGFEKTMENVAGEYEKRRLTAVDEGNTDLAIAQVDGMERDGLIDPGRAEALRIRSREGAEARQREDRIEAIEVDAAATPEMWLERNQEPGDMSPDEWQVGQSTARRVIAARTDAAASEIGDAMSLGEIKTAEDIDRIAAGRLKPAALAEAKDQFRKMQSDAWRSEQQSPAGVTKNFGLLLSEAEKYDKASDPDGSKYAGLIFKIKTLMPEELRGELTQPLARKWNPGNSADAPAPLKSFINETFQNWYDDGKFGQTKKRVPLSPEDPGYFQGIDKMKWVDDPPARDAAAAKRGQAQMAMDKWLKANPDASIEDAKKQLLRESSASLLPMDVNKLLRKPAPSAPAADPAARIQEIGKKFGVLKDGGFKARATGYFPVDPGDPNYEMQGGRMGASEWHGEAVKAEPLYTLDDWRDGTAPYVSVAMDNSTNNPLKYGTELRSPQFPGVPFRVMDTGSAFNGKTKKYGPAKGLGRIDIARRDKSGAWSSVNNREIEFMVANDAGDQTPPFTYE